MVTHNRIAIIPARGGSKRLPRKNVIAFGGKPMIAWTIEAAIQSGAFDHVIVSTDDREIATIAERFGAEAPFLRERYFDDDATVSLATIAALDQACRHFDQDFAVVVQLMANCPLRTSDDIATAIAAFDRSAAPFQISCVRFGWMNPWWAVTLDKHGRATPLFPDALGKKSQDLPPLYCPTGAIWIADTNALRKAGSFYGPGHRFEPVALFAGIDIDDETDLAMAELAMAARKVPA